MDRSKEGLLLTKAELSCALIQKTQEAPHGTYILRSDVHKRIISYCVKENTAVATNGLPGRSRVIGV